MYRARISQLNEWIKEGRRKPIVLRGARQVGKTWLIRHLAKVNNLSLIEINFERNPGLKSLFKSNDPHKIVNHLEASFNQSINAKDSLLFLDEIQAAPEMLAKLRWFSEDYPELAVVAAGSLLDFVLAEHSFSMPVGRIQYLHLEPLSFEEFLFACGKDKLCDLIASFDWNVEIPMLIHEQLMELFFEYIIVGGLPFVVSSWVEQRSLNKINQIHHDLLATYRDDFAKYAGKLPLSHLEDVLRMVPLFLGQKFKYSNINPNVQAAPIKKSLQLLTKARLCHRVISSSANGIPLGAEINDKKFKVILFDVGLVSTSLGLRLDQFSDVHTFDLVNHGGISEQVVGQLLRTIEPSYVEPMLYYWLREQSGSSAEVDYIIQHKTQLIPIEVKSGKAGTLKSLHSFISYKKSDLGVRINAHLPEKKLVEFKAQTGKIVQYTLLSLPFYMTSQVHRLLSSKLVTK